MKTLARSILISCFSLFFISCFAQSEVAVVEVGSSASDTYAGTFPGSDGFAMDNNMLHYCLIVISGENIRIRSIKAAVSDYNREFHGTGDLYLSSIYLDSDKDGLTDTDSPIIVLRSFDDREQAMQYYDAVKDKDDLLGKGTEDIQKSFYAISLDNYKLILKNRSLEGYDEFFKEHYLKK